MKGYKVFNPDWTCRGYQYTCPGTFEEDVAPSVCDSGFHFCEKLIDCFEYYGFNSSNHVAEVVALGRIATRGSESCTNKLQILREVPWEEVYDIVNIGKHCDGLGNCGDYNSGNWNCGNWNCGNLNIGSHNNGNDNVGWYNFGSENIGAYNAGYGNLGYWNKASFSSGCFCTEEQKIFMFNKPSNWTIEDWQYSGAKEIMDTTPIDIRDCACMQYWWDNLCEDDKLVIKSLPNFDAEIFREITGIIVKE